MSVSRRHVAAQLLAGVGLVGLAGPAMAQAATGQLIADPPVADLAPATDDPVDVATSRGASEHVMAPVMINGLGPYKFLIDTGANTSCVSQALADRLALKPGPPANIHTVVGYRRRPSVIIDHLKVGARMRRGVKAPALDISEKVGADGVLGVDWLKGQRLMLDFKRQTLEITKSRSEREAKGKVIVPASKRWGQLTIVDADASGTKVKALVDSGSQMTICNAPMRDLIFAAERRTGLTDPHEEVGMETLAGELFSGRQLYLPFLRLGGLHIGNVGVIYADMHVFKIWNLTKTPAIVLGMDLLTQFDSVALDYGRSAVTFDIA